MLKPYKNKWPNVSSSAFIENSARVIGDVTIGEESSVWFNAIVRGDVNYIRIGNRTNIQDASVIHVTHDTHPTILEDDITVGHSVTIHGCTIKSRVLIGMGAIILDGAVVESDSIVAAGALVTEGKEIPSGWMAMGVPAKPVRELTGQERASLLEHAQNYIRYKNEYMNDSK
ncbi:MAG TPA: gamma carbonic anhydrase family protein [Nitrospinota bacterium]|jgi:carbonic anhydrase/acetyltransferase-like protein (isoleucine patch superfamily)|nr:gamma carbonic anhydrase family protein [Nitrospinota bacterium]